MTRLFIRCNALWLLALALLANATAFVVPEQFATTLRLPAFLFMALAMAVLVIQRRTLDELEKTAHSVSQGDMEKRIILSHLPKEWRQLADSINRLIDVADAYIRESATSAEFAARGHFYRKILPAGLNGSWGRGAEKLNRSSDQVRQNLTATATAAGKKLETSVMKTVDQLDEATRDLVTTGGTLGEISSRGKGEADALATSTRTTTENVATIAAAVEEMTAAIKEINQQVHMLNSVAGQTAEESSMARQTLEHLNDSTQKIGEVSELISGIAEQVNLLALNATIEAARAGDAGKGFAVVAAEVKELAMRTSAATAEVDAIIQQIRNEAQDTGRVQNAIIEKISQISEAAANIAAAVEEQSVTTAEISSGLQQTSGAVQTFSGSVDSLATASKQTESAAGEMQQASSMLTAICSQLRGDVNDFLKQLAAV